MGDNSVSVLNGVLHNEFVAILQYFLHAKLLDDCGMYTLGKKIRSTSIDEMHHAEILIERILYLGGKPIIGSVNGINIALNAENMLRNDLQLEKESILYLQESIRVCKVDVGTEDMLRGILKSEEEHVGWIEEQLSLIKLIGIERYIEKNG